MVLVHATPPVCPPPQAEGGGADGMTDWDDR
jgi:hypothetical protein